MLAHRLKLRTLLPKPQNKPAIGKNDAKDTPKGNIGRVLSALHAIAPAPASQAAARSRTSPVNPKRKKPARQSPGRP